MNNLKKQIVVFEILSIILLICFTVSESHKEVTNIARGKTMYSMGQTHDNFKWGTDGIFKYNSLQIERGLKIWLQLNLEGYYYLKYIHAWMKPKKIDQWLKVSLKRGSSREWRACTHVLEEANDYTNMSCPGIMNLHSFFKLKFATNHHNVCLSEVEVYGYHDRCTPNPCLHGGKCQEHGESYNCTCTSLYTGKKCEIMTDPCWSNPCKHDGECKPNGTNKYICVCKEGYKGVVCDIKEIYVNECLDDNDCDIKNWCSSNPCFNGGTCKDKWDKFICICADYFTGKQCEKTSACKSSPCGHNGYCKRDGDNYKCNCKDGYTGEFCDKLEPCFPDPCKKGGICEDNGVSYKCKCEEGFKGEHCETLNPCWKNHCTIGGTCVEYGDSYNCTCKEDYRGELCLRKNPCLENPCQNNGTCQETENRYKCACQEGYNGTNCDETSSPIEAPPPSFMKKYYLVIALLLLIIIAVLVVCCCISKCKKSKK